MCEERKNHKKEINRLHAAVVVNMPTADCLCQALLRNVMHKRTGRQRQRQRKREGRQDGRKYTTSGSFKQIGKHSHTLAHLQLQSHTKVSHKSPLIELPTSADNNKYNNRTQQNPTKCNTPRGEPQHQHRSSIYNSPAPQTRALHGRRHRCPGRWHCNQRVSDAPFPATQGTLRALY